MGDSDENNVDDADFRRRKARALEVEREEAQGVEVFEDPDATIPRSDLKAGPPGEETLEGDDSSEDDEVPQKEFEDRW